MTDPTNDARTPQQRDRDDEAAARAEPWWVWGCGLCREIDETRVPYTDAEMAAGLHAITAHPDDNRPPVLVLYRGSG